MIFFTAIVISHLYDAFHQYLEALLVKYPAEYTDVCKWAVKSCDDD